MCNKAECIWNTNGHECRKPGLNTDTYICADGKLIKNEGVVMCNKHIKPNCKRKCSKCDYYDKNIDKLMKEPAEVDAQKCEGR